MNTNQTHQDGINEPKKDTNGPQKTEEAFDSKPRTNNPETPSKDEPKHSGKNPVDGGTAVS